MNYNKADFIASYGMSGQLPTLERPEKLSSGRSLSGSWLEMP